MHYTVYRVTNNINNKHYIGKHQTKDLNDGYMGSGKLIRAAIKKYGIEKFTKEILHVFDNEQEMNNKEKELVVLSEMSYNLCEGGKGGFGYINANELNNSNKDMDAIKRKFSEMRRGVKSPKHSEYMKEQYRLGLRAKNPPPPRYGNSPTNETRQKIGMANAVHQTGTGNSQYGTMWITNGVMNKKIHRDHTVPEGWYQGRKLKDKS